MKLLLILAVFLISITGINSQWCQNKCADNINLLQSCHNQEVYESIKNQTTPTFEQTRMVFTTELIIGFSIFTMYLSSPCGAYSLH